MLFNKYLKSVRQRTGTSLLELSQEIGVSYASARLWEVGSRIPSREFIHKLETFYRLPLGTIQSRIVKSNAIKVVYISHPLRGGDVQKNREEVTGICRALYKKYENILIVSPVHNFSYISTETDQTQVLAQCSELLSFADELWVFGDYQNSEGCLLEIRTAKELKIPVIYKTTKEV